jgi:hypothetical protein
VFPPNRKVEFDLMQFGIMGLRFRSYWLTIPLKVPFSMLKDLALLPMFLRF